MRNDGSFIHFGKKGLMQALQQTNPARCFYLFTQYYGPMLERTYRALSVRWPKHHFVFVNYVFLLPEENLKLKIFADGKIIEEETNVINLLRSIQNSVANHILQREILDYNEPGEAVLVSVPGWFNFLKPEDQLNSERLSEISHFLSPEYVRQSYHPHNIEQDGRIFRYTNLHSFDEAMNFLCNLEEYSFESIFFTLRAVDRMQK